MKTEFELLLLIATRSCEVFSSATGRMMSEGTVGKLLKETGFDAVPHGFRTSFRSWCSDSAVPHDLAERALAHVVRDSTERAYARSDMLDRRRKLMADWADYIADGPR